jgi:LysM repeat protein
VASRLAAACAVVWAAGALANARGIKPKAEPPHVTVTVHTGDTLWGIARKHTDPSDDVRSTLHAIKELNHLTGSLIQPGQALRVPL